MLFHANGDRWRCNRWMCDERDRVFDFWEKQSKQKDRRHGRYDDDDDMRGRRRDQLDDDDDDDDDDNDDDDDDYMKHC